VILELSAEAFSRPSYRLPARPLVNMFVEKTPDGLIFLPRPGLSSRSSAGDGPVRGVFRQKGTFAGSTFSVSGQVLYRLTSSQGTIAGISQVRMFASETQLVTIAPDVGKAYLFNGTALSEITDADLPSVADGFVMNGRAFYQRKDDDEWWFSEIGDFRSIDGLAFATAESKSDRTVRSLTVGPQAMFWGQESMEFWQGSDNPDAPLAFSGKYDIGCLAADSVLNIDGVVFGVGDDRRVYVTSGSAPTPISNPTVSERLRLAGDDAADCTAFPLIRDGHVFYGLNIPGQGTWVFSGQRWYEWASIGRETFRVGCGVISDGEPYLGDAENGTVWKFGENQHLDGSDRIIREVSAFIAPTDAPEPIHSLVLNCQPGMGALTDPEVEACYSEDGGQTFTPWQSRTVGRQGQYRNRAVWRRQGLVGKQGRLYRFRTSENMLFTARSASVNDARA